MKEERDNDFVEGLLRKLLESDLRNDIESLSSLFLKRITELGIPQTKVLEILDIQHRTLKGILTGTLRQVDFVSLIKLSSFLQIPREKTIFLYLNMLEKNFPEIGNTNDDRARFIQENFDLAALKKAGFIDNMLDFKHIEHKVNSFLGLRSIFEYRLPEWDTAFSSGKIKPKNHLNRAFWINSAKTIFEEIENPNTYDRNALIEFFPKVRKYSTNVEKGLLSVVRFLYQIGITVIYQAPLPSLHLRGATFCVQGKPCIVLTDYRGFYPTLWFSLVHELFHVVFDWEEIRKNEFWVSDPSANQISVQEKEDEADNFAREYLFSKDKTSKIKGQIFRNEVIEEFAIINDVHPSFVYVFNAYDCGGENSSAWMLAKKFNPGVDSSVKEFVNPWSNAATAIDYAKSKKRSIYS